MAKVHNLYDKNQTVQLRGEFRADGVLTTPTEGILKVKTPAGVETSYLLSLSQVQVISTGILGKDVKLTESGDWFYNWEGTGAVAGADENMLTVRISKFTS